MIKNIYTYNILKLVLFKIQITMKVVNKIEISPYYEGFGFVLIVDDVFYSIRGIFGKEN